MLISQKYLVFLTKLKTLAVNYFLETFGAQHTHSSSSTGQKFHFQNLHTNLSKRLLTTALNYEKLHQNKFEHFKSRFIWSTKVSNAGV